ncbi:MULTISPECIES: response regulator transcription factor [Actinotignum]|uniref:response regulator transcription factor n=1 Tax=Actinotignum TaxID=1653174 RepID=UPI0025504832|nr:response regulator transcription factor [Actinotignum timonense]MDK6906158.1 response regulator transcription factor [Actinotignum timonense]MDY5138697.1 response regulator transcription factor [Actinotignum timonense]MDY5157376.1 response regulator transcription factor [Actinotignum timonense]
MTTLLLVEDDAAISGPLARALTREGYAVTCVDTGLDALEQLAHGVDIMVLDLGLPDMDGLDVARQARGRGHTFPILILTARAEEVDMVVGLDSGADDYVTKPFRLAELLARVRALLRRTEQGTDHFTAQDISVDTGARRALRGGVELALTAKEFELLTALIRRAGDVVSREALFSEVWGDEKASASKKLDMHISWLRRKLGDDVDSPRYISTVRGLGFRFETR